MPPSSSSPSTSSSSSSASSNNNNTKKRKRHRLDKEHAKIVIVGSGLAGLSAAISLKRAGFKHVDVYERDDSLQVQKEGYGLTLSYNPKGPLASLGVLERVAQEDCPSRSHYLFRPDGSILGYFGNAFFQHRGLGQRGNLRVPRKVLRKILVETLQNYYNENRSNATTTTTSIHWGHRFVGATWKEETQQYTIEFERNYNDDKKKVIDDDDVNMTRHVVVNADLLVAADGIRSAVLSKLVYEKERQRLESNAPSIEQPPNQKNITTITNQLLGLRRMGVRLILGIADFEHPLLKHRGFYTLDGKHRLFTMPYQSPSQGSLPSFLLEKNSQDFSSSPKTTGRSRIMWQLSFATPTDFDESLSKADLQKYVLETCRSWHPPVLDMIQSTPLETIWGTDLMDRDPKDVLGLIQKHQTRRLVVVGDALHSMSPFKGQGANQALADGPLLAKWLEGSAVDSALVGFWRETVQRTAPVVAASHQAAKELHSAAAITGSSHGFAGVRSECVEDFVSLLQERKVGAAYQEANLDEAVANLIEEQRVGVIEEPESVSTESQKKALQFAAAGDTQGLRILSLAKQSSSIRSARDEHAKSCLHLALEGGHLGTCKWLLAEVGCDPAVVDQEGKTCLS